jgi:hypothetical protein
LVPFEVSVELPVPVLVVPEGYCVVVMVVPVVVEVSVPAPSGFESSTELVVVHPDRMRMKAVIRVAYSRLEVPGAVLGIIIDRYLLIGLPASGIDQNRQILKEMCADEQGKQNPFGKQKRLEGERIPWKPP